MLLHSCSCIQGGSCWRDGRTYKRAGGWDGRRSFKAREWWGGGGKYWCSFDGWSNTPPPGPHWEKVDLLLVRQIPQTWSIEVNISRHLYNLKYLTNVHLCCSVLWKHVCFTDTCDKNIGFEWDLQTGEGEAPEREMGGFLSTTIICILKIIFRIFLGHLVIPAGLTR